MAATGALAIGALREVAEWGFDRIAPGDVTKGENDTVIGIVMDTLGAGLSGLKFPRPGGETRPRAAASPAAPETP